MIGAQENWPGKPRLSEYRKFDVHAVACVLLWALECAAKEVWGDSASPALQVPALNLHARQCARHCLGSCKLPV